MYIDSHCHINFPDFADTLPEVLNLMQQNQVSHALCISVELEKLPDILALADKHAHIYASVGCIPTMKTVPSPA